MGNCSVNNRQPSGFWYEFWLFCKAQISAQMATLVDFGLTIFLATLCGVFYLYATLIGSVVGGIFNCAFNYRWVFNADHCKKSHVALKYVIVWLGSIFLNTWGTFVLTEWLTDMSWLKDLLGYYIDNVFILPKIVVAFLVGVFWNYYLQRQFVFKQTHFVRWWHNFRKNIRNK